MTEDLSILCPLCGNRVPPGLSKCPICATSLQSVIEKRAPAKIDIDAQQVDDYLHKELPRVEMPEAKRVCPFCAKELQGGEAKCPRCGIPLISESEMLECPECGALTPQGARACPSCGIGFEEEPQVQGPPILEEIPPPPIPGRPFTPTKPVEPAPEVVTTVPTGIPISPSEGLVNGRGSIDGTGLVNGTGMTNGTKVEGRLTPGRRGGLQIVRRWQFFAVLIALAIIIPTFVYISYAQETSPITVDGKFGEWAHIDKYGMYETGGSTQTAVDQWAVETDGAKLFLYVKTQGELMASSDVNSLYLFVDSDSSNTTGYRVSGIGADYLLELDGWDRSVQSSSISHYEPKSSTDQYDWSSWVKVGSLTSEVSGNELEAMADLPDAPSITANFLLFTQDNIGSSVSYPAPETGGLLVVKQEKGSGIDATGIVAQSRSVSILKLTLTCEGRSGIVESITPWIGGANQGTMFQNIPLTVGQERVLDVFVDTYSMASESSVTAQLTLSNISSTFAEVAIVGEPARAYVSARPTTIQIDGEFGDWVGRTSADGVDSIPVGNDNVDLNAVGAVNYTDSSYFYVSVVGQMCGGSYVPMTVTKPSGGGGGGGGIFIPTRKTGEDVLRIYIDSDLLQTSGYLMSIPSKVIGADYMVEIKGLDGEIRSKSLMSYGSGQWNVVPGAVVDAANDVHQLELGVALIDGSSSWDYVVETTDWSGRQDLATSVPDGARGWPVQSGLSLQGLGATSYPGQRKIFYDGTNLWSFYFDVTDTVCRYSTNGGQTWNVPSSGGSPFSGVPGGAAYASIWYDSANEAIYVVGDKSSGSKDLVVINGTVNPGTHTIAWLTGGAYPMTVSSNNLGSKYSYICKDASGYLWVLATNKTGSGATYDLSAFRSVYAGDVSLWAHSGNMIPGGDTRSGIKGSIVPAGTGSQVWAAYTYGGNVAARKFTASWSSQVLIQTDTGTLNGPMLLAPPSVVVDSRGVVHMVFGNCFENVTAKPHVMYSHNVTNSDSFTSGLDIDASIPGNVGDVSPTISIDSATGNRFVFWIRTDATNVGTMIMGKKNTSGTWTSQTFASDTTTEKRALTSIYSSPGETYISWQWTQNVTSKTIEVQFESKIPELPSVVTPVIFIVGVVMYASRRKLRRKA